MTCIVGVEVNGLVWMGGDSAFSDGNVCGLLAADDPKLWRIGDYVLGVAGSARVANLLRYNLKLPEAPRRGLLRHVIVAVVPALRKALKAGGGLLKSSSMDPQSGSGSEGGDTSNGSVLLAVRDRLFSIHGDFQVCRSRAGYDAIGSGYAVALGSLHTSAGKAPRVRVTAALAAAEAHACGVRRPWRVMQTP